MRPFTLVMAYYRNAGMLARQYEHWRGLPADIRANLQVIVTDDCSPAGEEARREDPGLDFQLFRITKKTPWNWMSCRNIGAHHATHDWLLLTDMDHLLPEAMARLLMESKLKGSAVYRFRRVDAPDMTPYKEHPNSWFMAKAMFDKIGGFDERWAGAYGSDYEFRNRVTANAESVRMIEAPLVRYPREVIADASTTDFGRKNSKYAANISRARNRIQAEGGPPLRLSYPYERVAG